MLLLQYKLFFLCLSALKSNNGRICCFFQIPSILWILWESLCLLDDLSASTSSILMLLAAIVSSSRAQSEWAVTGRKDISLSCVLPRLWPFLRHNILCVRKATLQTLKVILDTSDVRSNEVCCGYTCMYMDIFCFLHRSVFTRKICPMLLYLYLVFDVDVDMLHFLKGSHYPIIYYNLFRSFHICSLCFALKNLLKEKNVRFQVDN